MKEGYSYNDGRKFNRAQKCAKANEEDKGKERASKDVNNMMTHLHTQQKQDDRDWEGVQKEQYGDSMEQKGDTAIQIVFMNIRGLPFSNQHQKNIEICTLVQAHNMEILGLAETNINWFRILN